MTALDEENQSQGSQLVDDKDMEASAEEGFADVASNSLSLFASGLAFRIEVIL